MKKLFTLICSVVTAVLGFGHTAQAQVLQRADIGASKVIESATITPGENQQWWGYLTSASEAQGLGVKAIDTYHCAIFIPGDHYVAGGKTLRAVRFAIPATSLSDVKVWVASKLPNSISASTVLQSVDVPVSDLATGYADVPLPEAYALPIEGAYVGYSFKVTSLADDTDNFPILVGGEDTPNGLLIRTDSKVPSWTNFYGKGFGSLFLQVLLEGQTFENAAIPSNIGEIYALTGGTVSANVRVTNAGTKPMTSFSYKIESDGVFSTEQQVTFSDAVNYGASVTVPVDFAAENAQSRKIKKFVITQVNGENNGSAIKSTDFTLYTLDNPIERKVVVEEFTGTGCGWCPRGLVGMEKLRQAFGDRFIGIALHQYNADDVMYLNPDNYAALPLQSAPSCVVDRAFLADPYYGTGEDICDDFREEMAVPSLVDVQVKGHYNENETKVEATAEVEALFGDATYSVEFVLVADDLTGKGVIWNQANYYYQYLAQETGPDLAPFANGGKYGSSLIQGWKFNDVALSSSYVGQVNQVADLTFSTGGKQSVQYELSLPTKTALKQALRKGTLYVVALVIAPDGTIANAAKAAVTAYEPFPVQFANSDGTIVKDGSVLTLNQSEEDGFGGVVVPSNLFVKNVKDEAIRVGAVFTVESLSSGDFETCFPVNCLRKSSVGTFETGSGTLAAGELKNMKTEWYPVNEGTATVTYQLYTYAQNPLTGEWTPDQAGPKVTLNFAYGTAGLDCVATPVKAVAKVAYYDLLGRVVSQPAQGVFLKKTTFEDGTSTTQKVRVK
ncbi:MAG: hypothetical protein J6Y99_10645 [Bacteroidales bacterium]|nr:hypothetical protein [Bacteroidales bacterium]